MSKGYVYILTNECMPGLVKIGKTTRSVAGRANELYQTGVPTPFTVEAAILSPDCDEMERILHYRFDAERVSQAREFFRVDADIVVPQAYDVLKIQLEGFLAEFLPEEITYDWRLVKREAEEATPENDADNSPRLRVVE